MKSLELIMEMDRNEWKKTVVSYIKGTNMKLV